MPPASTSWSTRRSRGSTPRAGGEHVRRIDDPSQARPMTTGPLPLALARRPVRRVDLRSRAWPSSPPAAAASPAASSTRASPRSTATAPAGWSASTRLASWPRRTVGLRRRAGGRVRRRSDSPTPSSSCSRASRSNGANETRAALAFAGERRGVAAWLAAPAPSGALEFVSADATFAIAGLSKSSGRDVRRHAGDRARRG